MLALWEMNRLCTTNLFSIQTRGQRGVFCHIIFQSQTPERLKLNKLKTCSLPQACFTLSFGSVHFSIPLLMAHLVKLELMITVTTSNKGLFCEGFITVASG